MIYEMTRKNVLEKFQSVRIANKMVNLYRVKKLRSLHWLFVPILMS